MFYATIRFSSHQRDRLVEWERMNWERGWNTRKWTTDIINSHDSLISSNCLCSCQSLPVCFYLFTNCHVTPFDPISDDTGSSSHTQKIHLLSYSFKVGQFRNIYSRNIDKYIKNKVGWRAKVKKDIILTVKWRIEKYKKRKKNR